MATNMMGSSIILGFVDKRFDISASAFYATRIGSTRVTFASNAIGTNTTMVGVNANPTVDDTNVVKRYDRFRLYDSTGVPKEETVFAVTGVTVAASTTMTFTPPAVVATAVGDTARLIDLDDYGSMNALDTRLNALSPATYPQNVLDTMNVNDKVYALRLLADPTGM